MSDEQFRQVIAIMRVFLILLGVIAGQVIWISVQVTP